ncbi:MAG: hypothetical protein ACR2PG_14230 [Hyphomicrobiaceae bacterium]
MRMVLFQTSVVLATGALIRIKGLPVCRFAGSRKNRELVQLVAASYQNGTTTEFMEINRSPEDRRTLVRGR